MCVCAVPHRVVPLRLRGPNRSPEGEVVLPPVYCRHEEERQQAQIDTPPLLPHSSSRTTPHPTPLPRQTNCQCYINCSSSQTSVCTCCGHTQYSYSPVCLCDLSGVKTVGSKVVIAGSILCEYLDETPDWKIKTRSQDFLKLHPQLHCPPRAPPPPPS